jgi:rhodanese-related sulfurtransferase
MRSKRFLMTAVVLVFLVGLLAACSKSTDSTASSAPATGSEQGFTVLTAQQLHDMMAQQDVYLVNVHVPYEGEITGTDAFIPYTDIASRMSELPFDKQPVVIYCRSGVTSGMAAQALVQAGAPAFYELEGGYTAWQAAGYPFEVKPK